MATRNGTDDFDRLSGTNSRDVINGFSGNDVLSASPAMMQSAHPSPLMIEILELLV
jgi:Ca2+-binding RTX toxin-like protein